MASRFSVGSLEVRVGGRPSRAASHSATSRKDVEKHRIHDEEDPQEDTNEDHAWYDAYADNLGNDQELPKRFLETTEKLAKSF